MTIPLRNMVGCNCCSTCAGTICVTVQGCGANQSGATVSVTKHVGGAAVGTCTTAGTGICCVATSSTEAYDVAVSKAGFFSKTVTTTSVCTTTLTVVLPSSTLTVTVTGCNGLPLPGATVLLKEGGTTVLTATTDGSGVATFTLAHAIVAGTTVVVQKARFVDSSPMGIGLTDCTASVAMTTIAAGYVCCVYCADPMPMTLHGTVDGVGVTLTYDGIGNWHGCYAKSVAGFVYNNVFSGGINNCTQSSATITAPFHVKFTCGALAFPGTSARVLVTWPSSNNNLGTPEKPSQYSYICPSGPTPLGGWPCTGGDRVCADAGISNPEFFVGHTTLPGGCSVDQDTVNEGLVDNSGASTPTCNPFSYSGTANFNPHVSGISHSLSITSIAFVITE